MQIDVRHNHGGQPQGNGQRWRMLSGYGAAGMVVFQVSLPFLWEIQHRHSLNFPVLYVFYCVERWYIRDIVYSIAFLFLIKTRAPHGRRHSPAPMLRVKQGSTSTT